jgi:hypothetical protein
VLQVDTKNESQNERHRQAYDRLRPGELRGRKSQVKKKELGGEIKRKMIKDSHSQAATCVDEQPGEHYRCGERAQD